MTPTNILSLQMRARDDKDGRKAGTGCNGGEDKLRCTVSPLCFSCYRSFITMTDILSLWTRPGGNEDRRKGQGSKFKGLRSRVKFEGLRSG